MKIGTTAFCVFFLVPGFAYCQQDILPGLPELETAGSSGFVQDVLPPAAPATESAPATALKPYEQQLAGVDAAQKAFQIQQQAPFQQADLSLAPPLLQASNPVKAPNLIAAPIKSSLAKSYVGRQMLSDSEPYNLKIGDIRWQFGFSTSLSANDNINASETNRQFDLIIEPDLQVSAVWRLSNENALRLDMGVGYQLYMLHLKEHPNSLTLSPGSRLAVDVYSGDFRFNVYDKFSLEQDATTEPGLGNVANAGIFTNDIGGSVTWDLDQFIYQVGYDHTDVLSLQANPDYPNHTIDAFRSRNTFTINPSVTTGLDAEFDVATYTAQASNLLFSNSQSIQIGPFLQWRLTAATTLQAEGGYQGLFATTSGTGAAAIRSEPLNWYGNVTFTQNLNSHISQGISLGRQAAAGLSASDERLMYISHKASCSLNDKVGIGTMLYLEKADEIGGQNPEKSTRFACGLSANWVLGKKVTLSTAYQFIIKISEQPGLGYTQNQVTLTLNYRF